MNHPIRSVASRSSRASQWILILTTASVLTLLLAFTLGAVGIWLAFRHHIICLQFLEGPIIFIGSAMLLASVVGVVGVRKHKPFLIWAYLIVLLFLLLLLFCFTLFGFFVSAIGGGHASRSGSFKEYQLDDYSQWFQDKLSDPLNWMKVKMCVQDRGACVGLRKKYPTLVDFQVAKLNPIQSGCCKPPTACEYTFVSPTQWINRPGVPDVSDCGRWNNDPSTLCFDCHSCKAGLLEYVRKDWTQVAKVCLTVLILLLLLYVISWVVFLTSLHDGTFISSIRQHGFSRGDQSTQRA